MIDIVITSFKEPKTIGKAIQSFLNQDIKEDYNITISAPDEETLDIAREFQKNHKNIRIIKDEGKGKPSALNKLFKQLKGNIIILSDGDVYVSRDSLKFLVRHFNDKSIGGVTARVVSKNFPNNLLGFWADILVQGIHNLKLLESKENKNVLCSGYLYAIRNRLINKIPEDVLADDAFISFLINKKGYKTIYEPNAEVYVKYPTNLKDWISQKKRTAGKFYQLNKYFSISKLSSFKDELLSGIKCIFKINSIKKVFWFILLIIMRLYIWFRIFFDIRLWKRSFKKTWERVESTK